jgi:hypothetical protein
VFLKHGMENRFVSEEGFIVRSNRELTYKGNNGSERKAGHYRHHREEKVPVVWPR